MRLILAALLLAAACGNGQRAATLQGHARISTRVQAGQTVCATLTLQPMAIDGSGNTSTAGSPVVLTPGAPGPILGCIDSFSGNDWGYLVTATDFNDCHGNPVAASPGTVTQFVPFDCKASLDTPVAIDIAVSIPAAGEGGYVDISTSVNATAVSIGCKSADVQDGVVHFGEAQISSGTPLGLTGIQGAATPTLWASQVGVAPTLDTSYTGTYPGTDAVIFQTFGASCPAGQGYSDSSHPQCLTTVSAGAASTTASLASAFIASADLYAAASLSGNAVQLTYGANPSWSSLSTQAANALATTASVSAPAGTCSLTGVWPARAQADAFVVSTLGCDGTPGYATVAFSGGAWSMTAPAPLASQTVSMLTCLGLFSTAGAGCAAPVVCGAPPPPPSCDQFVIDRTAFEQWFTQHVPGSTAAQADAHFFQSITNCDYVAISYWVCLQPYESYLSGLIASGTPLASLPTENLPLSNPPCHPNGTAGTCSCF